VLIGVNRKALQLLHSDLNKMLKQLGHYKAGVISFVFTVVFSSFYY
jgi:hypothetical protein